MIRPFQPGDVWPLGLCAFVRGLLAVFGPRGASALRSAGEGAEPARGIRLGRQGVRMAGLGLCLVGIGWLYQRFVRPERGLAFTAEEGYSPPR